MSIKYLLPFLGAFFLFQTSCVNDSQASEPSFDNNQLIGRWEIVEAFRNGRKTETLTDTFYEFEENGSMKTNLTPTATEEKYMYDFAGNEIKQKGGAETVFKVENLSDSSLTMTMVIQKFPFRLVLAKAAEAVDSTSEEGILQ